MRAPPLENDRLPHLRQMRMRLTVRRVLPKVPQAKKPPQIHVRQEKLLLLELLVEQVQGLLLLVEQAGPEPHQAEPELRGLLLAQALLPEELQVPHPTPEQQQEPQQEEVRPVAQRQQDQQVVQHQKPGQQGRLLQMQAGPRVPKDQLQQALATAVEKKRRIQEQAS